MQKCRAIIRFFGFAIVFGIIVGMFSHCLYAGTRLTTAEAELGIILVLAAVVGMFDYCLDVGTRLAAVEARLAVITEILCLVDANKKGK